MLAPLASVAAATANANAAGDYDPADPAPLGRGFNDQLQIIA